MSRFLDWLGDFTFDLVILGCLGFLWGLGGLTIVTIFQTLFK